MIRKLVATAVLCMAGLASAAETADRYVNETVGFSVTKPAGWHWMTAQQNLENLKRARVGSEEFNELIVRKATAPLVVMTQHQEPYDGLNASFKANIRPFGALPTRDAVELLSMILPTLQRQMTDARVATPVRPTEVDGQPAAHVAIDYTLRTAEGGEFPTASEIWIVPAGDFFFMLGAGYSQGDAKTKSQIAVVLDSVDLSSPAL